MSEYLLVYEPALRLLSFCGVFVAVAIWETALPRKRPTISRWGRWPGNLALSVLNTLLVRVLAPATAVGVAILSQQQGWGLLNQVTIPLWLAAAVAVLVLDLIIYLQHMLMHRVPLLWRLHRVHHADLDFDLTTGVRFHPFEILVSTLIKLAAVLTIGAPVVAVVVFEVILSVTSIFNHGNVRLPVAVDRVLRWLLVTPDMHRVHHSIVPDEMNSNFGFNLPWWDRLFGTYRAQPAGGHEKMVVGLEQFHKPEDLRLDRMLIQPFRLSG